MARLTKKQKEALAKIEKGRVYSLNEASALVKEITNTKFDASVDYLVAKCGLKWLEQPEDAWRKRYPKITEKIDDLQMRIEKIENEK